MIYTARHLTSRKNTSTKAFRAENETRNRDYFNNLAFEEFVQGHKDPSKPLDDNNIVMQPESLNRAFKDKYVFDDHGLPRNPTVKELVSNISNYYNEEEQTQLFVALRNAYCNRKDCLNNR